MKTLTLVAAAFLASAFAHSPSARAAEQEPGEPPEDDCEDEMLASVRPAGEPAPLVQPSTARARNASNAMLTITTRTLLGAATGLMLGGAFCILDWRHRDVVNFAYWTGLGALAGAGLGLIEVLAGGTETQQHRLEEPMPAPVLELPVMRIRR
jgi:hypothetical protein